MSYCEKETSEEQQLKIKILRLALSVEVVMFAVKAVAYYLTGSVVIFSDALESISHILSASFASYALWLMTIPADRDHPFGHGNISYISAIIEASMMLLAGITTYSLAFEKFFNPKSLTSVDVGFWISASVGAINLILGLWLIQFGKRKNSLIIKTNGKHVLSDAVTSVGVIISLLLIQITGIELIDVISAFVVATYICISSIFIFKEAVAGIMDQSDAIDDHQIRSVIEQYYDRDLLGFHALRHRHVGAIHQVDFHLLFNDSIGLQKAHEIASKIERHIDTILGQAVVTAHLEPYFVHENTHHSKGLPEST